jgi:hypothetical protein
MKIMAIKFEKLNGTEYRNKVDVLRISKMINGTTGYRARATG